LGAAEESLKLPSAYRLIAFDSLASSNEEARRLAEEGAEDGTLVWTREQTAGRGRQGRIWQSPPGNLYFSLILRPECPLRRAVQLGFAASLAMADAIGAVAPPLVEVTFKWPNDLLANGRKAAGLLMEGKGGAEGELDWLIIGMGVNVKSFPKDTEFPATSLSFEGCGPQVTDRALLEAFARHFLAWVNRWLEDGFEPLRKAWLRHAEGIGQEIRVRLPGETLSGIFEDLDAEGHLMLRLAEGGARRVSVGDVFFGSGAGEG
jgi:BirA family biotin operon repressor/biotin-[acetyl-CoA-carboxylase] ligase